MYPWSRRDARILSAKRFAHAPPTSNSRQVWARLHLDAESLGFINKCVIDASSSFRIRRDETDSFFICSPYTRFIAARFFQSFIREPVVHCVPKPAFAVDGEYIAT